MATLLLLGTVFNILIFFASLIYTSEWKPSAIYFKICLFFSIINALTTYLILSKHILDFPHFYRVGTISLYIFLGGLVLFTQKTFKQNIFRWSDLLFFLPAIIYFVDYSHFFIQSADTKRAIINHDFAYNEVKLFKESLFFPPLVHYYLRSIIALLTFSYQIVFIVKILRRNSKTFLAENKQLVLWGLVFSFLLVLGFAPHIYHIINGSSPGFDDVLVAIHTLLIMVVFPVSLIFAPQLLYGTKGFWSEEMVSPSKKQVTTTQKVYYTAEKAELMKIEIEFCMTENKLYLNPNFNLNELAQATNFPVRHISAFLNNYLNCSFTDYVNQFRVNDFIYRLQNDPEAKKITYEALSIECGFPSRFTFLNAFKKQMGKTPSQYFG